MKQLNSSFLVIFSFDLTVCLVSYQLLRTMCGVPAAAFKFDESYLYTACPVADCRKTVRISDIIHQKKGLGFVEKLLRDAVKPVIIKKKKETENVLTNRSDQLLYKTGTKR